MATGGNNAPHEPVPLFEKMRSLTRNRVRDDTGAVIRGKGEQGGRAALFPLPFIKSTCHPDRREGSHLSRFRHYVASHLARACHCSKAAPFKGPSGCSTVVQDCSRASPFKGSKIQVCQSWSFVVLGLSIRFLRAESPAYSSPMATPWVMNPHEGSRAP